MKTTHLQCSKQDVVCRDPQGHLWPNDFLPPGSSKPGHCFDCSVQCQGDAPGSPDAEPQALCNKNLTAITMWMTGFQTASEPNDPCVAFLLAQLPLTSRLRFALACIGTFFMGLLNAGLGWASRSAEKGMPAITAKSAVAARLRMRGEVVLVIIYLVRMTLAYLLMLVAMMYQVELFVMVIAGLVVGHYMFTIRTEGSDDTIDPCCC